MPPSLSDARRLPHDFYVTPVCRPCTLILLPPCLDPRVVSTAMGIDCVQKTQVCLLKTVVVESMGSFPVLMISEVLDIINGYHCYWPHFSLLDMSSEPKPSKDMADDRLGGDVDGGNQATGNRGMHHRLSRSMRNCAGGWAIYGSQPVFLANLSLAMLYVQFAYNCVLSLGSEFKFFINLVFSSNLVLGFECLPTLLYYPQVYDCFVPGIPYVLLPQVEWTHGGRGQRLPWSRSHYWPHCNLPLSLAKENVG